MDGAGVCAAFRLLIFEFIEFRQHIDRNPYVIVVEPVDAVRVMKQDICIEDEVLAGYDSFAAGPGGCFFPRRSRHGAEILEKARLFGGWRCERFNMLHEI